MGEQVLFFYRNRLSRLDLDAGSWTHSEVDFPFAVDASFAAAAEGSLLYVLAAEAPHLFSLQPDGERVRALAPMPEQPRRGARIAGDGRGHLYAIVAGGHPSDKGSKKLFRYEVAGDRWLSLPQVESVNNPGRYSSGLHHVDGSLFTYGDHHIARFDLESEAWQILFYVMRYRPFLDRGGMSAVDPSTRSIYVTLGGESNSLGVLSTRDATFHYLRPRLPFQLGDAGETFFLTHREAGKRLHLLSNRERAIYSIEVGSLLRIGTPQAGKTADVGSPWESQNVSRRGAHGGLFRHFDSYCSGVYIAPYFYYQRKNVLRRVNPLTSSVSPIEGLYRFHQHFSTSGAAIATDGQGRLYLFTGHDRIFFQVEIDPEEADTSDEPGNVLGSTHFGDSATGRVRRLADLPEVPSRNTAAAYFDDSLLAILRPDSRTVHRYVPGRDRWTTAGELPAKVTYGEATGLSLVRAGERLYLLANDALFAYDTRSAVESGGPPFEHFMDLSFALSDDGGMTAWDPTTRRIYASVGAGSRRLGVIDLDRQKSFLSAVDFPDAVSVAGQRMFVLDDKLYIYRGHDSAELWRIDCDHL